MTCSRLVRHEKQRKYLFLPRSSGLTLLEFVLTMAVLCIVTAFVTPVFADAIDNYRLKSTLHSIYSTLQLARQEAVRSGESISVSFKSDDGDWCYGISDAQSLEGCDCLQANRCTVDSVEKAFHFPNNAGIKLRQAKFAGDDDILVFSPEHGMAVGGGSVRSGSVWLQSGQDKLSAVVISRLGRIRICNAGETDCPSPPVLP